MRTRSRCSSRVRHPERARRNPDPPFRPADALRHRRLGHQERVRDLGRREAADGAQRERDRRGRRQRRMAAHEQHGSACRPRSETSGGGASRRATAALALSPGPARCATGRSAGATRSGSASRGARPERRPAASARPPRSTPPGRRPRRRRSRRTGGRARRGPAAPARAAGPRHGGRAQRPPPACSRNAVHLGSVGRARSITCRTWIGCWIGTPSGPRHGRDPRGNLDRALLGFHVDDLVAGQPLLELLERPVRDHRRCGAVRGDDLGQVRPGQGLQFDQLAVGDQLLCSASR